MRSHRLEKCLLMGSAPDWIRRLNRDSRDGGIPSIHQLGLWAENEMKSGGCKAVRYERLELLIAFLTRAHRH